MRSSSANRFGELIMLVGIGAVCWGCLASTYRSARVMNKGQGSIGVGYIKPISTDGDEREDHYGSIDSRIGSGAGWDFGLAYFNELTEGEGSTLLFDTRVQLTNRENEVGKPILTLGFGKGYFVDGEMHLTRIPFALGIPLSTSTILTGTYNGDFFSEGVLPGGDDDPSIRNNLTLGVEIDLAQRNTSSWVPKFGLGVGYLGGEDWKEAWTVNLGFSVDTP